MRAINIPRIVSYHIDDNGDYRADISGISLNKDDVLMLDNGLSLQADVKVIDPFMITAKQRKKIFAMCNDIEAVTGQPREYMRKMFIDYYRFKEGIDDKVSLSNCSKRTAIDIIEIIIHWLFKHNIELSYETSALMQDEQYFIYNATINRNCVICGKPKSDIAHRYAVGVGRDRKQISHIGNEVLALCREHHTLQHQIGIKEFNKKYHLENSWIKVTPKIDRMLRYEQVED